MSERSVNIQELTEHKLLWGDLMWVKKSGNSTRVGSCGEFVDLEFVNKLVEKEATLEMNSYINWKLVNEQLEVFKKLEVATNERERVELRDQFWIPFSSTFLGSEEGSYIDWFTICYRSFYELPKDIEDIYYLKNSDALKRSMALASMTTLLAFAMGHMNYSFLKKLFNSCLVADLDFVNKGMSEFHLRDLEKQRVDQSSAFESQLLKQFSHHGANVDHYLDQVTEGEFIFKHLVKLHHENLSLGNGPEGLWSSEVGDLAHIMSFVENLIPYVDFDLRKGDATGLLTDYISKLRGFERLKAMMRLEVGRTA